MLEIGRSYHVTLYVNATAGTTGFVAELVEVSLPLTRWRNTETGEELVLNVTSPAFVGAKAAGRGDDD